jgi:protein tyrosine/serine phosphatase
MLWALVLLHSVCLAGQRGLPPQEGIANFGKVSDGLYRGAQPDTIGIQNLKRLGIKSIISLWSAGDAWKLEVFQADAHGIVHTNIPMSGVRRPKDKEVRHVLALIEKLPGPVFIHCHYGCDRTGTIVACYRIQHDRWSPQEALREAQRYGLSKLERGMKRYIASFKAQE